MSRGFDTVDKLLTAISEFGAVFLDEAEDLGKPTLDMFNRKISSESIKKGYFWILFDHLQMSPADSGAMYFKDNNNKETTKMMRIYRNSININSCIREDPLISMFTPGTSIGHSIKGPPVESVQAHVKSKGALSSKGTKHLVLLKLFNEVNHLTSSQGIHEGDIAITFDDFDYETIFGDELTKQSECADESKEKKVNENTEETEDAKQKVDIKEDINKRLHDLASKVYGTQELDPKKMPLSSSNVNETALFPHTKKTNCLCKYFVGPYQKLKGLTVKVVIHVFVQGSEEGHNRLAAYTALSRSSCLVKMFSVKVKSMNMEKYQFEKAKYMASKETLLNFTFKFGRMTKKTTLKHQDQNKCDVFCVDRYGTVKEIGTNYCGHAPSAFGGGWQGFNSISETTGTLSHLRARVTEGIETEWLENCLIPSTSYTFPIKGNPCFIRGHEQWTNPTNPHGRKKGGRKFVRNTFLERLRENYMKTEEL